MAAFDELLKAVGFTAADGAARISRAQRDLNRGVGDLALAGEEQRGAINANAEERGVYNSGERGLSLARQAGQESAAYADLEAAYADEVAGVNQGIMRAIAQEDARKEMLAAQRGIRESDYQAELDLIRRGAGADMASLMRQWNVDVAAVNNARRANSIALEAASAQAQQPVIDYSALNQYLTQPSGSSGGSWSSKLGWW